MNAAELCLSVPLGGNFAHESAVVVGAPDVIAAVVVPDVIAVVVVPEVIAVLLLQHFSLLLL